VLAGCACALLVSCTANPSSPSTTPADTHEGSPAPQGTPVGTLVPPSAPTSWRTGTIDQQYTTPALEFRSTGTYLIWSTGARVDPAVQTEADSAPDLFAALPGGEPILLYDNPNRDSRLEFIGGYGDRFAFVEDNVRAFGLGGWKLWYLVGLGGRPQLLDQGGTGQWPFFEMSDGYLVWSHGDENTSQLRLLDLTTMVQRVLVSEPAVKAQFYFPHIDGSRLVYNTRTLSPDDSDICEVFFRDLASDAPPVRLDVSDTASEPAIHGDHIVWKETDPTISFLNAGTLVLYSLATRTIEPLRIPTIGTLGFTEPSMGNRYVAAWPQTNRRLYLADLQNGTFPPVLDLGPSKSQNPDYVGHPDLAGDLLAYIFGPAGGDLELRWVVLR
jgi:hypothetical protein